MNHKNDESFERLELLIMSHEETLERFSELLRDQQNQLADLKGEVELLRDKLSKYEPTDEPDDYHQPPPHY